MEVTRVVGVERVFRIGDAQAHALRGVSVAIQSGEFTALVGPSGSGKTTLLQLIGRLDQPTRGEIFINGRPATGLNRDQRADLRKGTIGSYLSSSLIPTLTAART
jgi:putative ABC transport system ATP-binding protein